LRISAVIAAHDAEPWLGEAIDSALRELPADSELVVVDDGSTDGTPALLEGYRDRATLLRNDTARGPGFSRNRGAGAARGEILAFHDADDVVLPGRFSELAAVLESRPEVDLVFGNGFKIDETGHRLGPVIPRRYTRRLLQRCGPAEMLIGGFVYPQALSIRHERFESLGGFMHARVEDWEFALRASLELNMLFVDQPVFLYRRHSGSMTMKQNVYAQQMLDMLERFVAENPEIVRRVPARQLADARARRWVRAGKHRLRAGDHAGALEAMRRAVELRPLSPYYRWRLLTLPRASAAGA
jgi:glycosyltransferase involved in cell wall biosynthesis